MSTGNLTLIKYDAVVRIVTSEFPGKVRDHLIACGTDLDNTKIVSGLDSSARRFRAVECRFTVNACDPFDATSRAEDRVRYPIGLLSTIVVGLSVEVTVAVGDLPVSVREVLRVVSEGKVTVNAETHTPEWPKGTEFSAQRAAMRRGLITWSSSSTHLQLTSTGQKSYNAGRNA